MNIFMWSLTAVVTAVEIGEGSGGYTAFETLPTE